MRTYARTTTLGRLVRAAAEWPTSSVLVARRNALVASTDIARTRAEQREVEEFLAAHAAERTARLHGAHSVTSHTA